MVQVKPYKCLCLYTVAMAESIHDMTHRGFVDQLRGAGYTEVEIPKLLQSDQGQAALKSVEQELASLKSMRPKADGTDADTRRWERVLAFKQNFAQRLRIRANLSVKESGQILSDNAFFRALSMIIGTAREVAIPYLIDELKNENWMRRWVAAKLLGGQTGASGTIQPHQLSQRIAE